MLVTQFEQTYARRAFPCFDEPALKAVFRLSIARQTTWTVLSNMPEKDQTSVYVSIIFSIVEKSLNLHKKKFAETKQVLKSGFG
jgi:Peptidase M1 N-terminal domain